MIEARSAGDQLAVVFAEIVIVPHLGLNKPSSEDIIPIAQIDADPKMGNWASAPSGTWQPRMGFAYADAFRGAMRRNTEMFKSLVKQLGIKV